MAAEETKTGEPPCCMTFGYIKPDGMVHQAEILAEIEKSGLELFRGFTTDINREDAEKLYEEHAGKPFFEGLIGHTTSDVVCMLLIVGPGAVAAWRRIVESLRDRLATDGPPTAAKPERTPGPKNVVHGSISEFEAYREAGLFCPEVIRSLWFYREPMQRAFAHALQLQSAHFGGGRIDEVTMRGAFLDRLRKIAGTASFGPEIVAAVTGNTLGAEDASETVGRAMAIRPIDFAT